MKSFYSILIALLISMTAFAKEKAPKIVFEKTTYEYGNIKKADGDASCEFKFTNKGNAPLIITRASSSCGCTAPTYPKEPIAPGESGVIGVTYHAKGRPGGFSKNITIYTNVPEEKIKLIISGNVIPQNQ